MEQTTLVVRLVFGLLADIRAVALECGQEVNDWVLAALRAAVTAARDRGRGRMLPGGEPAGESSVALAAVPRNTQKRRGGSKVGQKYRKASLADFKVTMLPGGEVLRLILKEGGMTQDGLAKIMGVSRVTVSRWILGKSEPGRKHREALERICLEKCIPYRQQQAYFVLTEMVENYDVTTSNHSARVCILAREVGKLMPKLKRTELHIGSAHHDVGKITCSLALLNKPGRFSEIEREEMKKHATAGELLVTKMIPEYPEAGKIVGQHHERLDGKGYVGLRAEEIMKETRVLAVCDVFDALTSCRSYKDRYSVENALAWLLKDAGHDQGIVEKLDLMLRKTCLLDVLETEQHKYIYDDREAFYAKKLPEKGRDM